MGWIYISSNCQYTEGIWSHESITKGLNIYRKEVQRRIPEVHSKFKGPGDSDVRHIAKDEKVSILEKNNEIENLRNMMVQLSNESNFSKKWSACHMMANLINTKEKHNNNNKSNG